MVFSSSVFLFAFLPAVLAVYFVLPWRPGTTKYTSRNAGKNANKNMADEKTIDCA